MPADRPTPAEMREAARRIGRDARFLGQSKKPLCLARATRLARVAAWLEQEAARDDR